MSAVKMSGSDRLENVNPQLFATLGDRARRDEDWDENVTDPFDSREVDVTFTPTIPHCSMATLIGLAIRVKLLRSLPPRFKVRVSITPGSHASEVAVNKQLADKERVAAALENAHLLNVVNQCLIKPTEE
eukprot:TCALIF_08268-PA protein Name:"Similar to CG7949 MIP18 family protein CG7949 (Drosophila melanogaster)" AED:0.07 eAED:0.10 QI:0/0/0.5/1/1/1/2/3208/129